VSSYATDDGERLLLFDPMTPPSEIDALAAHRETTVVLTCPWHERATESLVERLDVPVYTPLPERTWLSPAVTPEQVVEGLRPLLDLPVEHVLATHGGPFDRAALERALS
jgi:hypothetical protein